MIYGRFLGTLLAIVLADIFTDGITALPVRMIAWFILAVIGTAASLVFSGLIGIQGFDNQPLPQDSIDYWLLVFKGDEDMAKKALEYWYDER